MTRYLDEAVTFPKVSETETKLELTINQKVKIASKMYKLINNISGDKWKAVQRNWETDLDTSWEAEEWDEFPDQ